MRARRGADKAVSEDAGVEWWGGTGDGAVIVNHAKREYVDPARRFDASWSFDADGGPSQFIAHVVLVRWRGDAAEWVDRVDPSYADVTGCAHADDVA